MMKYFLWFVLFKLYQASYSFINDMTRYSADFLWNRGDIGSGVITKYIPLGAKYYLFPDPTKKILFFIQCYKEKETNSLFYLIYLEIPAANEQYVKVHVLYNESSNWNQFEFLFDKFHYEGLQFQHSVYYSSKIKQIVIEVGSGVDQKQTGYIPYQNLINKNCIVIIGGSLNLIHPITNEELIMQTFPGKFYVALSLSQTEIKQYWKQQLESFSCLTTQNLLLDEQFFENPKQNQIYTISQQNLKYYKISFWCIISGVSKFEQDEEINIIRVTANKFTSDFLQSGSNSFVLKYTYNSQKQIWQANVEYYSYLTPLLLKFQKDHDPYKIYDQILLSDYKYINSWHFILIEYSDNHILKFSFQNIQENFEFMKQYENVQQFSNIYYRLFFGGSPLETSTMPRSFALISFYNCQQKTVQCHHSCKTCYGPLLNQCYSCDSTQNRYFDSEQQKCLCYLWYTEDDDGSCSFATQEHVTISIKDEENSDLETFDEFCQFGQFSYKEQCFFCPSAKQKNSVICSECLMRPIDWINNKPSCTQNFQLFNNDANNNYIELQPDHQIQNFYFLFQNEQLVPCEGCQICYVMSATCLKSEYYNHLNQETYIECLTGFQFENGKCNAIIAQIVPQCSYSCKKCSQTQCLICKNQEKYFLNLFGQCQLCSIQFCKQCFQFNTFDYTQNTIFKDENTLSDQYEDYVIGCALCVQGHFYSFISQQCLKYEENFEFNFFLNEISEKEQFQVNFQRMQNDFQEIIDCVSFIPNCKICIYNNLHLNVCSQCNEGYFLNIRNGMCLSCSQQLGYNVQTCNIESDLENSYKFQLLGFSQYFSQHYVDYFHLTSQLSQITISTCKDNFIRNTITNSCLESCQNCDQCQFEQGQTQCLKCTSFELNSFNSQQAGKCYSCPYPCRFCLPIDVDLIQKYNPYFIITEESIEQAKKCLVNFDDNLTFINSKSGLTQPLDNITKEKKQFYVESLIPITSVEEGDYILSTSSSEFFEFLFISSQPYLFAQPISRLDVQTQMQNIFYSLKKTTFQIFPCEVDMTYDFISFNVTNFILRDLQYVLKRSPSTLQLISQYGINVEIQNVSIQFISEKFLYIFNLTKLNIIDFQFINVKVKKYIIQIDHCISNAQIKIFNVSFFDSVFQDSSFINVTSENMIKVNMYNLSFINCKFSESNILNYNLLNKNSNIIIKNVNLINCTLINSILFQFTKLVNPIILTQLVILDTLFLNSSLTISVSSIQVIDVILTNLELQQSILFSQIFGSPEQNMHYSNIILTSIQFVNSNLISLSPLSQFIYFDSIIQNLMLHNITETLNLDNTENYFIFVQNSDIKLQNISVSNNMAIQLIKLQNCQKISLSDFIFTTNQISFEDFAQISIFKNYLIYIQEFTEIYFNSITFQNISQFTDSLIQIRSNDNQQKLILIENLKLVNFSNFNDEKSQNSAIFISTQAISTIRVIDCVFSNIDLRYVEQNSDNYSSAVIKIQSPLSRVFVSSTLFSDINIFNSSESIIMIEAESLIISFINVEKINSFNNNYLKSMTGFCVILAQNVFIENSKFKIIYSIYYGVIFIQLKYLGVVTLLNCFFEQENYFLNLKPHFGGVIGINAEFAQLKLFFSNVTAKYFLTQECCAFLYLIPSQLQNKLVLENINLLKLFSSDHSISYFNFQQNVENNNIEITNVILNNLLNQGENEPFSLIHSQLYNSSNTQGLLSFIKSNVKIQNFSFIGKLYSPILSIIEANVVLIKDIIFYQMSLDYDLSYLIKLQGTTIRKLLIDDIQIENFQTKNILKNFIVIDLMQTIQRILISNLITKNIQCENCESGVLFVQFQENQQRIQLKNINIISSNCGKFSCLQFFNAQVLFDSNKYLNLVILEQGILNLQNSSVIFKNLIIKNCKSLGKAGALSINNTIISGQNSAFINNSADIGAGIYMLQAKLTQSQLLQIMFYENYGKKGLNNVREFPDFVSLKMFNVTLKTKRNHFNNYTIDTPLYLVDQYNKRLEESMIKIKSGQKIGQFEIFDKISLSYKPNKIQLQLELFTQLGEKVIDSSQQKCFISQKSIIFSNTSNNSYEFSEITESIFDNQAVVYFNHSTKSYQLDDLIFYQDPYLDSNQTLIVQVQCETLDSNYFYYFMAKTIPCQIGEYFHSNGRNSECLQCDYEKGYFSVEKNSSECQRQDPKKIVKVSSSVIELQKGFWRYSIYSHDIEECDLPFRCLGGSQVNYQSCQTGYIGANCKECDLYNIRANTKFIKSLNGECQQFKIELEIIILTIFLMIFILCITYAIGYLKMRMQYNYKTYKAHSIHYKILFKCSLDDINTRLKQLIRLSQIILQIIVKSNLPINLSHLYWPIAKSQTTLQGLIQFGAQNFSIQIIYLKAIWTILIPLIQTTGLSLAYITILFLRKRKLDCQIIWFFFYFLLFYSIPSIVEEFSQLFQQQQLGNIYWVGANVSYQYYTQEHQNWIFFLIIPGIISFGLIIPFFIVFRLMAFSKQKLKNITNGIFGYVCSDYKVNFYLWELFSFQLILFIVFIHFYFEDTLNLFRYLLNLIILFIYYVLISIFNPFIKNELNQIEKRSTFSICILTSISCLLSSANKDSIINLNLLTNTIIIIMLLFIIGYNIQELLLSILNRNNQIFYFILQFLNQNFPNFSKQFFQKLKVKRETRIILKQKIQLIKNQLKNIKKNRKSLKHSFNNSAEDTHGLTSNLMRSDQRVLLLSFPQVQQSIFL